MDRVRLVVDNLNNPYPRRAVRRLRADWSTPDHAPDWKSVCHWFDSDPGHQIQSVATISLA